MGPCTLFFTSREDMVEMLGRIGHSGTAKFLENLKLQKVHSFNKAGCQRWHSQFSDWSVWCGFLLLLHGFSTSNLKGFGRSASLFKELATRIKGSNYQVSRRVTFGVLTVLVHIQLPRLRALLAVTSLFLTQFRNQDCDATQVRFKGIFPKESNQRHSQEVFQFCGLQYQA